MFCVDLPQIISIDVERINVGIFKTRQEAIEFCKNFFVADSEGRISLITEVKKKKNKIQK